MEAVVAKKVKLRLYQSHLVRKKSPATPTGSRVE
jgi:hypothetical protein